MRGEALNEALNEASFSTAFYIGANHLTYVGFIDEQRAEDKREEGGWALRSRTPMRGENSSKTEFSPRKTIKCTVKEQLTRAGFESLRAFETAKETPGEEERNANGRLTDKADRRSSNRIVRSEWSSDIQRLFYTKKKYKNHSFLPLDLVERRASRSSLRDFPCAF